MKPLAFPRSPWHPNPPPKVCELCGAEAYGFTIAPLFRVCKTCLRLPLLNIISAATARGLDATSRIPDVSDL